MILHAGIANRTQKDAIEGAQLVGAILGHHLPQLGVALATPIEFHPIKGETETAANFFQYRRRRRHHFMADPIARYQGNPIV